MNARWLAIALLPAVALADTHTPGVENLGPATDRWDFRVMLDDREIGQHSFERSTDGAVEEISIEARFKVKVLFVTAYRYTHDNRETWQNGCLQAISSSTNDNGTSYVVNGRESGDGFSLLRNESPSDLPLACVKTFAYWNPHILEADQLLNAQTGELKPVSVDYQGERELQLAGNSVVSDEYVIRIPDGEITVWYQQDNRQWLGLQTLTAGDRVLRYEALSVPEMPGHHLLSQESTASEEPPRVVLRPPAP
jgi:hypothetical protein